MAVRVYGLAGNGDATSWTSSESLDPQAWADKILSMDPDRTVFAWADPRYTPTVRGLGTDRTFYAFCAALIERGQHVGDVNEAIEALQEWALLENLDLRPITAGAAKAGAAEAVKAKPGQTQIVQEWLGQMNDEQRMAMLDRAWEAMHAVAKGA